MNKRLWTMISVLLLVAMVFSACAAPATPAPAAEEAPAAAAPAQEAAPAAAVATEAPAAEAAPMADVALRWRTRPDNQEEIDVYQQVSNDLDAGMDGVALTYEPGGSESSSYQDVLKTEIAAGTAPDVFWIPGTDVADFATRGLILNVADLANATDGFSTADFYPGPMSFLTYNPESMANDALWGLPRDVSTFALYLNRT